MIDSTELDTAVIKWKQEKDKFNDDFLVSYCIDMDQTISNYSNNPIYTHNNDIKNFLQKKKEDMRDSFENNDDYYIEIILNFISKNYFNHYITCLIKDYLKSGIIGKYKPLKRWVTPFLNIPSNWDYDGEDEKGDNVFTITWPVKRYSLITDGTIPYQ